MIAVIGLRSAKNLPNLGLRHAGMKLLQPDQIEWRTVDVPHQPCKAENANNDQDGKRAKYGRQYAFHDVTNFAERPGSPTPGQGSSIVN